MARLRVCPVPGCGELVKQGRCDTHARQADRARGTARQRGYDYQHETRFRRQVLARDKWCVTPGCNELATRADHHPLSRRELVAKGLDPNDPKHGRGLCERHHNQHTARTQPGGWNQ